MSKPKLQYFDAGGRAESIRMCCYLGGLDFEDDRIPLDVFPSRKATGEFPLGSVPVWIEDGEKFCTSNTILRMVGMRTGMYTTVPETAWMIDSSLEAVEDVYNNVAPYIIALMSGGEIPQDAKDKTCLFVDKTCALIERRLSSHGKAFVAGTDTPTIADLKVSSHYFDFLLNPMMPIPAADRALFLGCIDKCPAAKRYLEVTMKGVLANYCKMRMDQMKAAAPAQAAPATQKPCVMYFDLYARAEAMRMTLAYAGVDFEDKRLSFEQFGAMKASGELPSGQLPLYIDENGKKYNQNCAILNMLAKKHGLRPSDPERCFTVDWALETLNDALSSGIASMKLGLSLIHI